jgi:lipoprotein signal peptidase
MLRTILALVIAAHGIGHFLFLVPLLGIADWGQSTRSWLLVDHTAARFVGSLFWIAVIVAFGAAVFGLLGQHSWWRNAAILASVISIVALILFWVNPVSSPAFSALAFNLIVIGALLIAHWPTVEAVGA